MMPEFPSCFIRGLSEENSLTEDNSLTVTAFQFSNVHGRDDYQESSINWCDGELEMVKNFTLNQLKKDGVTPQFRVGIAIIPKDLLDKTKRLAPNYFDYERSPIEEPRNDYHGNLLLKKNTKKQIRSTIQGILCSDEKTKIILRDE